MGDVGRGMVSLLGPADIRALADKLALRPTKRLGQNFVVDGGTVRRIVRTAQVGAGDVVIEVGPGLGSLTLALLEQVRRVIAVEIDPVLAGLAVALAAGVAVVTGLVCLGAHRDDHSSPIRATDR